MKPRKVYISWNGVVDACSGLIDNLPPGFLGIVPVARGGLVPATIISYKLDLPIIDLTYVEHRPIKASYGILVVDDVCDTGKTFVRLRDTWPEATFAAPFVKPRGMDHCDHWYTEVEQDDWLVFPWAPNDEVNLIRGISNAG
jgi:xanthine phosphoribosyltransferase